MLFLLFLCLFEANTRGFDPGFLTGTLASRFNPPSFYQTNESGTDFNL